MTLQEKDLKNVGDEFKYPIWNQITDQVLSQVRVQVSNQVMNQVLSQVRVQNRRSILRLLAIESL